MMPDEMERVADEVGFKTEVKPKHVGRRVKHGEDWIHVRIPHSVRNWMSVMAKANDRSDSYIARAMVLEGLAAVSENPDLSIMERMYIVPYDPNTQDS